MKYLYLLAIVFIGSCGNKKAAIVEEIKKAKNELAEAELKRSDFKSASSKLQAYYSTLEASKKYKSKRMEMDAKAYKEGYETSIGHLKGISPEILKSQKKLDSAALSYETKTWALKNRIDSLELELKKY